MTTTVRLPCNVEGCDRPKAPGPGKKYCGPCSARSLLDRFNERVDRDGPVFGDSRCWLWTGTINNNGYGKIVVGCTMQYAHRVAYELFVGPIPPGLEIDHLCRVTACSNPEHLEPVTHLENMRRAASVIVACPQGHPYDAVNTYVHPATGDRHCRACDAARAAARYQQKKASA